MYAKNMVSALVILTAFVAIAEEPSRTVSVTGTMVTKIEPDIVNWFVSIESTNPVLSEARKANETSVKAVMDVVRDLGVEGKDCQTGTLSIQRVHDNSITGKRTFKHWSVQRTVAVKQRDLARFAELYDRIIAATEVEATYTFESSKYEEMRWETRREAVRLAKKKAEDMCRELGASLGLVLSISEEAQSPMPWVSSHANAIGDPGANGSLVVDWAGGPGGTLAPGLLDIRETVHVTFTIE
jgi:uncharacterized protein YggE